MADFLFNNTEVAFSTKSDTELKKALYLFAAINSPLLTRVGKGVVKAGLQLRLPVSGLIKKTLFQHFCGGETIGECDFVIQRLSNHGIGTILDYAVEGEDTEEDYDHTCSEILKTIDKAAESVDIPFSVFKPTGIGSAGLMTKIQQKRPLSAGEETAYKKMRDRYSAICKRAWEKDVRIFIDSEESWYQDTVDNLAYDMMKSYNKEKPVVFNTYQMYRKDMMTRLKNAFRRAVMHRYHLGTKIVRGAYMEKERERASELRYQDPILPDKASTDAAFNEALKFCIQNNQRVAVCCGSHNEDSCFYLTLLMEAHSLRKDDERVYFAQLYGMGDHISYNLAHAGYNVVKYVPYGPVRAVVPYLFRRAEENSSISGHSGRELLLIKSELQRRKKTGGFPPVKS